MDAASMEPTIMPLDLLREITDDFSEERELGRGSFGMVYLGEHRDGKRIAVKKLYDMPGLDDTHFWNEFKNLSSLRHENIMRLVGYCHDIQEVHVMHEGKLVVAEKTHRALCLEYMSNGSLDKYLSDECDKYDWHKGYRIIKGICQGLNYLHNELKPPIYHLDLKPANILLDEKMVPRIADFGISRLFGDERTRATKSSLGTIGYLPPEYIKNNFVSNKFDIFSLGVVIIKIMAGHAGYFNSAEMSSKEFTDLVQKNWTNRLLETSNLRNAYSEQVKMCIEIGLSCVQEDRHKRPTIQDIVYRLEETETKCTYAARAEYSQYPLSSEPILTEEAHRNTFPQDGPDPNDRHTQQIYHGSTFNQHSQLRDTVPNTNSNYFEQYHGPREARLGDASQFCRNDNQEYSADGYPLHGIVGYQNVGDPRLGSTSKGGFPTNGTTRGNFQDPRDGGGGLAWSLEENKMFEEALARVDRDRWERVAALLPGKTVADVMMHYDDLINNVCFTGAGLVPFPHYNGGGVSWTLEENQVFEEALMWVDVDAPDRWEMVALLLPRKTVADVMMHYDDLINNVCFTEAGLVPFPHYNGCGVSWTLEENQVFEEALMCVDVDAPDRWELVALMLPRKTVADVMKHYDDLGNKVGFIESGLAPFPHNNGGDGGSSPASGFTLDKYGGGTSAAWRSSAHVT